MADAPRVTVDQLKTWMEAGEDVIPVDVRRAAYEESAVKIKGAVRIDPDGIESGYRRLPAGAHVVTYCT